MVDPRVGLRRRRRTVPDDARTNEEREADNSENDDNANEAGSNSFGMHRDTELRESQHVRRVRRLGSPPPPAPQLLRPNPAGNPTRNPHVGGNRDSNGRLRSNRLTQVYCTISVILAILAVVITPSDKSSVLDTKSHMDAAASLPWSSIENVAKAAVAGIAVRRGELSHLDTSNITASIQQWWNASMQELQQNGKSAKKRSTSTVQLESSSGPFWWWRHNRQRDGGQKKSPSSGGGGISKSGDNENLRSRVYRIFSPWIDPSRILRLSAATPTEIIDNILTSIPRLLAIANFMLTMTYLLHFAIASWFLDEHGTMSTPTAGRGTTGSQGAGDWASPARERIGGFLVFKLLLISAVVAPDTFDLLILLTWYTTLSCLRSLNHLANERTTHLNSLGQPPRSGVLNLLLLVLVGDVVAAASCVALFHAAGWGMVMLLTCDCITLAAQVISHILKYFTCLLEDVHSQTIQSLEARQLGLHNSISNQGQHQQGDSNVEDLEHFNHHTLEDAADEDHEHYTQVEEHTRHTLPAGEAWEQSRQLDRRMESLELAHARRLSIMDNFIFSLDLLYHVLSVTHFCHIWSLHGVQFTLIDAVLALHLHASISSACRKIARRRNMHGIAKDLQSHFPNASDEELRKASAAGDVCCICLGTMSTGGHVKKVPCGHLYHTHCLREVVERAQSIEAAKCPLCRSSLLNGRCQSDETHTARNPVAGLVQEVARPVGGGDFQTQQGGAAGDHALIRFSTEDILPDWLPVPAFSFEVVRRAAPAPSIPGPALMADRQNRLFGDVRDGAVEDDGSVIRAHPRAADQVPVIHQPQDATSFLRRLLVLAGAIPMSPEEEARALGHLVDMFPQYERSHLLRELRERGSAEAVVEAIMAGVFTSGVPRGGT